MVISESLAPGVGVLLRRAKVGTERFFLQLSFQFCLLLKQVLLVAAADRGNKTTALIMLPQGLEGVCEQRGPPDDNFEY